MADSVWRQTRANSRWRMVDSMSQKQTGLSLFVLSAIRHQLYALICAEARAAWGPDSWPAAVSGLRAARNGTDGYQLAFAVDLPLSGWLSPHYS